MARFLTVTPNPAIDVTYTVEQQAIGETIRVHGVRRTAGGKGLNVARVLRALGCDAAAILPLGGQGAFFRDELTRSGMPFLACPVSGSTRTTVAVVDGIVHPTLYAEPGTPLAESEWTSLAAAVRDNAVPGGWVVIAGSFPPQSVTAHLALLIDAAHAGGARVLVDTSGPLLVAAAEVGADVVKANESEICEATGADLLDGAVEIFAQRGVVLVVTRGADGVALRLPDGTTYLQPAIPGISGNPTGAGDAATAGLVAALAVDQDPRSALLSSVACGAAAVLSDLAGEIDPDALAALAERAPTGRRTDPPSLPREIGAHRDHTHED
ncbi:1-phosphofructokinase [Microbacterium sp. CFBP 13617]|uniref:1-phosphofructokinase family hexose kinase n=1 Tax=Microbacterium sp. CFBP 13617 TaxID=2774035 RepID=UPI001783D956|nr:PfkB family carbohydrate kinase [Microbacterium sp. CFBP 13617]MBD8217727.1 1-phosphofructokinase [Microbacterium sp. CFBP 13617]